MLCCGLKLTHDGAVALISEGELVFSVEAEKLDNQARYSPLQDLNLVTGQLKRHGVRLTDLDEVSIDGWHARGGRTMLQVRDLVHGEQKIEVAGYRDGSDGDSRSDPWASVTGSFRFGSRTVRFRSFLHATNHVLAGYCTSPFTHDDGLALVLVWDGGMPACLFSFDPIDCSLRNEGVALPITGALYPVFAGSLETFRADHHATVTWRDLAGGALSFDSQQDQAPDLSVSGKAMALAGLGEIDDDALGVFRSVTRSWAPSDLSRSVVWSAKVLRRLAPLQLPDATVMASFQEFLCQLLLTGLKHKIATTRADGRPGCFVGGCALNIKWNSALRDSGVFRELWIPPFPNDSGSSIGVACAEMVRTTRRSSLQWSVFSGPALLHEQRALPTGWKKRPCDIEELAALLHHTQEPIVVLNGRAELGPRALGHRSILASAANSAMRDRLNSIKGREWYRPVAPVCLEKRAQEIFAPGTRDPYMLFDHLVRQHWRRRIPAVVHHDGSARLQTVGPENELLFRLLNAYTRESGVPVLCNTSANYPGSGFFPDAVSAMRWDKTGYIWSEGVLYVNDWTSPRRYGASRRGQR